MKKIKEYKIGETVEFIFLGENKTGIVTGVDGKQNKLKVRGSNDINYQVSVSDKESKFCYLI